MTEYQITFWRDLPSMVVARNADTTTKTPLPQRFQEAIDEAAMRLGATDSAAYLDGWIRADWVETGDDPAAACERVVADLEAEWSSERVSAYLDTLADPAE
ncbi:MAG: virulence factor [Actinomycetales bacterium]